MSYKVFCMDQDNRKTPQRRAGSVLPYSRVDDIYMSHHPWNREALSRPVCEGLILLIGDPMHHILYCYYLKQPKEHLISEMQRTKVFAHPKKILGCANTFVRLVYIRYPLIVQNHTTGHWDKNSVLLLSFFYN